MDYIGYMREHLESVGTVEKAVERFGYSKFHFSREFKRLTGFSAKQFLSSLKMEKSIESLVRRNSWVLSVHLQAEFLSSGTFSSSFEKQTGSEKSESAESMEVCNEKD